MSDIIEKIHGAERLSFEDGAFLMKSNNLLQLGLLADQVKERLHGNNVYFIQNTHLNYTNVCYLQCKLCAFGVKPNHPSSYSLSLDDLKQKFIEMKGKGYKELHIVGGVNPKLPFSYYEDMMTISKQHNPDIHIQAFTAVEIDYLAKVAKIPVEKALERLRKAGLDSILGGGAEIFDPVIRKTISGHKTNASRWFDIHRKTHEIGMKSNASILYGHIEKPEHVIDHLIRLRDLQDETHGFNAFFGFAFQPENTDLAKEFQIENETTGWYDLKILAVARLMLDNFPHIRAFWMLIGKKLAQVALQFGADDLDGTVMEEQIVHAAGNSAAQMIPKQWFIDMIKETGKKPVERDTLYNVIQTYH
ncbi:aminodeoxyfutalosine synthase [Salibacterium salarium]|uniref:aminofutalosine synthase MqnE n=1 Tax=Salibacterium salarium TaxID=284579 RepID=UPI0027822B0F|nr:aminofutalosine synthase MqnE [Salibacterium salarium]MDQ0298413.1 aminodeoxyfutalosine synthase [Salibacterium salarium]